MNVIHDYTHSSVEVIIMMFIPSCLGIPPPSQQNLQLQSSFGMLYLIYGIVCRCSFINDNFAVISLKDDIALKKRRIRL